MATRKTMMGNTVRSEEQVNEPLVKRNVDQKHEENDDRPQCKRRYPEWIRDYMT